MKKILFLACIIFCAVAALGAVLEEFASPKDFLVRKSTETGFALVREGDRLALQRRDGMPDRTEFFCRKNPRLPEEFQGGTIRLTVSHTTPAPQEFINLRLNDAEGEVFQFRSSAVISRDDGSRIYEFQVGEKRWETSWGKSANKKIDYPLAFYGLSIRFSGFGTLFFEKLEWVEPDRGRTVEVITPLFNLKNSVGGMKSVYQGQCEVTEENGAIAFTGDAKTVHLVLPKTQLLTPAGMAVLHLRVEKGDLTPYLVIKDTKGKSQRLKGVPGKAEGELRFDISDAAALHYFGFDTKGGAFVLKITKAEHHRQIPAAEAVNFEIATGNPLGLLPPERGAEAKARFQNPTAEQIEAKAKVRFEDFYGASFERSYSFALKPGETREFPIAEHFPAVGYWQATSFITSGENSREAIRKSTFALLRPGEPSAYPGRGEFLFGMNCHLSRFTPEAFDLALQALTAARVKLVRSGIWWDYFQPEPDRFNHAPGDRLVNALHERGITLHWVLHPTPQWAAPAEVRGKGYWVWSRTAPLPGLYGHAAEEIARRYRGKLFCLELWNEADINQRFTFDSYLAMMKEGYLGAKQGDPELSVTTTGFTSMSHPRLISPDFQERVLREGKGFYDIHAYHGHGSFGEYASTLDRQVLPMRQRAGTDKPWYPSETGVTSAGGLEKMQTRTVFKKILFGWSRGAISHIWFRLRSPGWNPLDAEHNYGLMTNDFRPKSGYVAYAVTAEIYSGLHFEQQLTGLPGQYLFRFGGEDRKVLAAWNENTSAPTVPLAVATDAAAAKQVDLMGNTTEFPARDGVVLFPVGSDPSSLIMERATRAEVLQPLVEADYPAGFLPGKPVRVKLRLRNPFQTVRSFQLQIPPATGMAFDRSEGRLEFPPQEEKSWEFSLTPPKGFKTGAVRINYEILPEKSSGTLLLPITAATIVTAAPAAGREPDFRLHSQNQVYNRYQADPASIHRLWKGPQDLSANVWLQKRNAGLALTIEVRDDVHHQPFSGADAYSGDCLQLALQSGDQLGAWEIGLWRTNEGESGKHIWLSPSNCDPSAAVAGIQLKTGRNGDITRYEVFLPWDALSLKPESLCRGLRFNLLVNDNDGEGRDGWISLAPNFKNPENAPLIAAEP